MTSDGPRFDQVAVPNALWAESQRGRRITVPGEKFISADTKFFAMGSCFAVEIRRALRAQGRAIYPDYQSISFDPVTQSPGLLPDRDNINHYDTFVIRQEIERAIEGRRCYESDFWAVSPPGFLRQKNWPRAYQDPYRRHIFANSLSALTDLSDKISSYIEEGLAAADVVIFTLGLTECWRVKSNGLYATLGPRNEADEIFPLLEFRATEFRENYENLRAITSAIWVKFPAKKIVFTISPVALAEHGRTRMSCGPISRARRRCALPWDSSAGSFQASRIGPRSSLRWLGTPSRKMVAM